MSLPTSITFQPTDLETIATATGRVAVIITPDGKLDQAARRANRLTKGALARLVASESFAKAKPGKVISLAWPTGMAAEALDVLVLARRVTPVEARKSGAALAKIKGDKALLVMTGNMNRAADLALGLALRDYRFEAHKSDAKNSVGDITIHHSRADEMDQTLPPMLAVAEGVRMTRDLVNEPANVLTTTEFAYRLDEMSSLGLKVEVLDEEQLEKLGMRKIGRAHV